MSFENKPRCAISCHFEKISNPAPGGGDYEYNYYRCTTCQNFPDTDWNCGCNTSNKTPAPPVEIGRTKSGEEFNRCSGCKNRIFTAEENKANKKRKMAYSGYVKDPRMDQMEDRLKGMEAQILSMQQQISTLAEKEQ